MKVHALNMSKFGISLEYLELNGNLVCFISGGPMLLHSYLPVATLWYPPKLTDKEKHSIVKEQTFERSLVGKDRFHLWNLFA